MALETWFPALLGYLAPVGLFLLAWGGMPPARARRSATVGALTLALAAVGYFAVGFAFHLGGAQVVSPVPGLAGLDALYEGADGWGLVGLRGFFLAGEAATPAAMALFVTYLPAVAGAVLLPTLSLHDRARGWQVVAVGLTVAAVVFPLAACWAWGGGWLANLGTTMERGHGFVDYAGAGVVYFLGGMAALGALSGLGMRLPSDAEEVAEMPPAHFPLLAHLGAMLFGVGLLGWSLSTPFHVAGATLSLPRVALNVLLAGAGGTLAVQTYAWFTVGYAEPLMAARGAAAGFVAIAAGAPFVPPWAALVVGAVAGLVLPLGVYLVERVLRLPDGTAAVPLGIFGGLWGVLAVALFADGRQGAGWNGVGLTEYHTVAGQGVTGFFPAAGFIADGVGQLTSQLVGLGALALVGFLLPWLLMKAFAVGAVGTTASPDATGAVGTGAALVRSRRPRPQMRLVRSKRPRP